MATPDRFEGSGPLSFNEQLLRDTIRHAINVQRLKAQLARETVGFLNSKVFPDLLEKLLVRLERISLRGADSGVWTTARYQKLVDDLNDVISGGMKDAAANLEQLLKDATRIEAAFAVKQVTQKSPVEISFTLPSAKVLNTIVTSEPFNGAVMKDWFQDLSQKTQRRVVQQVNIGLVEGESVPDIARRLRGTRAAGFSDGVLQTTRRDAEAIARTAAGHVSARSREAVYAENSDVIKGVMWVSTLDASTCPVCAARDGEVFPVNEGPRPEAHWNCRCSTTPVLRTWRDLGVDIEEIDPGTRASMDGQVPASMSFPEWLKGQPTSTQNDVLGPVRARLWRAGELDFGDFVDDRGRTLTLAELAAKEGVKVPEQYV